MILRGNNFLCPSLLNWEHVCDAMNKIFLNSRFILTLFDVVVRFGKVQLDDAFYFSFFL